MAGVVASGCVLRRGRVGARQQVRQQQAPGSGLRGPPPRLRRTRQVILRIFRDQIDVAGLGQQQVCLEREFCYQRARPQSPV